MTTCQNNICQTKPANDDWPDRTPDKTTPAKAGVSSSELTTSSPCNTTCQNPNQTTPAHHQSTRRDHNTPANDDAPHEEMDHTPAVAGYRLNHPQNESPKPNAPRNTPDGPQMNHTCFGGCVIILRWSSQMTTRRMNPPGNDDVTGHDTCQTNHANHDRPDQTQESTTHPQKWVCVCHLDPTPATPLNEHRRMTTHPLNESRKRQQVETMTQALDEPHTRRSGYSSEPTSPTEAMTRRMKTCNHRQYHMPAQAVNKNKTQD
ncbi:hypothetical protein BS47DRAFT_1365936 [Hydnum rufescens UP504]|uniref:Uncharacterized protein n=1 Tax=Hydnum rufescens UP504 TaxID=1448309 RepID=A0A9P6APB5_9AGAM|nr:hypothetical protein BS47DRAFT_1365936 [Hydnum rufescens UP504]